MWDALAKMSAWRFVLILLFFLALALLVAVLIDNGDISDEAMKTIVTGAVSGLTAGVGGFAAGARLRKGAPKKWSGKERRKKK